MINAELHAIHICTRYITLSDAKHSPGNTNNTFGDGISQNEDGVGAERRDGSRDGDEGGKAKTTRNRRISGGR